MTNARKKQDKYLKWIEFMHVQGAYIDPPAGLLDDEPKPPKADNSIKLEITKQYKEEKTVVVKSTKAIIKEILEIYPNYESYKYCTDKQKKQKVRYYYEVYHDIDYFNFLNILKKGKLKKSRF